MLTSVGAFMTPLDGSIVAVALPAIGPALRLQFTDALWIQAAYLLTVSILLIPFGRLADAHGRLRFFLGGVVVFTVGSVAAGLATGALWLVIARCVQGAGGALLGATSPALVTAAFPPSRRGRVLGINVTAVYLGLAVGPPLGGLLVDHLGWRWIFFVNVPVGAVTFLLGWLLLHEAVGRRLDAAEVLAPTGLPPAPSPDRAPAGGSPAVVAASGLPAGAKEATGLSCGRSVDLCGTGLLALMLSMLLVPLTFAPLWGWTALATLGLLAVAAAAFVLFVFLEERIADPVLDLNLVRHNRLFAAANLAALLNYMAMQGIAILTAVFLEIVQKRSAQEAGLILIAQPVLMVALSWAAGRASDRIGARLPATLGMLVISGGMTLLAFLPAHASTMRVMFSLALIGVGMAMFSSPNTSSVMGSVDRTQLSVASAFLGTMRFMGQALSVAVLGGIAAIQLGRSGSRVLLLGASAAGAFHGAAANYAHGYRYAMLTGAGLAFAGAMVSLVRPSMKPPSSTQGPAAQAQ